MMAHLNQVVLPLEPTDIPEWEDEDALSGVLGKEERLADPEQVAAILRAVRFTLPSTLTVQDLVSYARQRSTPLDVTIIPSCERYDYRLVEVPLNVLVPPPNRLVRLRLALHMETDGVDPVVAYDIFPPDRWVVTDHDIGGFSLDVSKALRFAFPAIPADVIGINLKLPLRWKTRAATIMTSDRNANPAEWYVRDEEIASAFTPYAIIQSTKGARVTIAAELAGELRRKGPLGLLKGRFRSLPGDAQTFRL
jgi:hypothetical protein